MKSMAPQLKPRVCTKQFSEENTTAFDWSAVQAKMMSDECCLFCIFIVSKSITIQDNDWEATVERIRLFLKVSMKKINETTQTATKALEQVHSVHSDYFALLGCKTIHTKMNIKRDWIPQTQSHRFARVVYSVCVSVMCVNRLSGKWGHTCQ